MAPPRVRAPVPDTVALPIAAMVLAARRVAMVDTALDPGALPAMIKEPATG